MMRMLGGGMQVLGLVLLPVAVFLELSQALTRAHGVSQMLLLMVFGAAMFWLGRLIEGYTRPEA